MGSLGKKCRRRWRSAHVILSTIVIATLVSGCETGSIDAIPALSQVDLTQSNPPEDNLLVSWQPLSPAIGGDGPLMERLSSSQTGIDFVVPIDTSHALKRLYEGGFFCGGAAIGDVDGDQQPDIYLVSGPGTNRLYRQVGDFRFGFEDITQRAGVDGGDAWGAGAAMVDIDNDGDLDIYLCNYDSPNLLYLNQGAGTFVESARSFGLDIVDCSVMPSFCDYDRDGDLDCYLLTNRYYRAGGLPKDMKLITRNGRLYLPQEYQKYYAIRTTGENRGELSLIGRPDRLLQNNGDGTFTDVTLEAGISTEPGHGLSATWWDFNGDGRHDLYVGNDFNDPDHLYRNNGDGTFTDVIAQTVPHTSWFSMGADAGDINNDGRFDFLIADMSSTTHFGQKTTMGEMGKNKRFLETAVPRQYMRNALYLNTGTERFMEVAYLCGLASSDWTWSVRFADLDNDQRLDVFITNGMSRNLNDSDLPFTLADQMRVGGTKWDLYQDKPPMPQQNLAFHNRGNLTFADVSRAWGLDHVGMSFAAAMADLDRDGDLDMVVANLDEPVSIYRNRSTEGHRVLVQLRGTHSNHYGIGAVLRAETSAGTQVRQLIPVTGYLTSDEPMVHFGLGDETSIRTLTIHWPSGHRQTLDDVPADRLYVIREPDSPAPAPRHPEPSPTLFRRSTMLAEARHHERTFDDFEREPLLPNKLSQLGPGLASGDVDGDRDEDLYLGGAAGQSGMIYLNEGSQRFTTARQAALEADAACEDMASLLFDADGDGDLDLLVVSGGVECEREDKLLQDRLYLNDGQGHFHSAPHGTLPDDRTSGSAAAACDFDRDGDLDLFIGGRVIPGQYPLAPPSRLLRNDRGRFIDVTQALAPELAQTGLVTGAVWSDADGDGWLDLVVTHEWGPVKLFRNDRGRLVDQTRAAGLDALLGWWNGIAARDLNGDGAMDYVVTNFGLNTKYHASEKNPALLFYGDFDGSGHMQLVEAEYEGNTLFPVRGKSCSTHAMPFLGGKFPTFKSFAIASLETIYTPECLEKAQRFEATTFESGVLLNDGTGKFTFHALPHLAQASPSFGVALTEINGDGNADLYLVQNFFSPQVETGRMDGGLSLLLAGNGDGTFRPIEPAQSGLVVPGDAKSLVVTDLNGDLWPDFVVGVNDDQAMAFEHQGQMGARVLEVRLKGPKGNPTAIGARVTVYPDQGVRQTAEVHAGSGYLSQPTPALTFGLWSAHLIDRIEVRWPDGSQSTHQVPPDQQRVQIEYAESVNAN